MSTACHGFCFGRRRAKLLCLILTVVICLPAVVRAELSGPDSDDQRVTKLVTVLLAKQHLSQHPLDNEISERCLHIFLKSLDQMKVYFTAQDVAAFEERREDLDDMARKGDIRFAYEVFDVFLKRVDERVALIDELLKQEPDFTLDEQIISDPDAAQYAETEDVTYDQWRQRIKYDLLLLKADKADPIVGEEAREKLHRRYHSFAKRMRQISDDDLLEMYLTSLTTSYDPHTSYMSASSKENFEIQMRLQLDGIGAALQSEDGYTMVNKIIPGGAAALEGHLKPKDRVIEVGQGEEGPMVDVVDMRLDDVVKLIRGKKGTIVRLKVIPEGTVEPQTYTITRASIELKDSEARGDVFDVGQGPDGQPYKVGVINLPSFYMDMEAARLRKPDFKSTTRDVRKILEGFNREGVDAVVIDLRTNGGGSLTEAITLTGLFIDTGPVVQVKGPEGQAQAYSDDDEGEAWTGPLVVMISKFSASASEIFAGALQDYGRALIVGDHATHGKGTVQSLLDLGQTFFKGEKLGALKLTMQQFYRPNGASTQNRGVLSDVELPSLTTHLEVGESDLEYAREFDQVDAAEYESVEQIDPTVLDQLRQRSAERCQTSTDFKKVEENIARYLERKSRTTMTLNEEQFLAQRPPEDKDEQDVLEEAANPTQEGIQRDFYLDEVLDITLDYLQLSTAVAKTD